MNLMQLPEYTLEICLAFAMVGNFAYTAIHKLQQRAQALLAARSTTAHFYELADELFREPNLPDALKTVLYDMLLAVTKNDVGKVAFEAIAVPLDGKHRQTARDSSLHEVVAELHSRHPDIAEKMLEAMRTALASILIEHGHSSGRVVVSVVENVSRQSELVRTTERLERSLGGLVTMPRQLAA